MGTKRHFPRLVPSGNDLIMIVPLVFLTGVCDLQTSGTLIKTPLLDLLMPEALF